MQQNRWALKFYLAAILLLCIVSIIVMDFQSYKVTIPIVLRNNTTPLLTTEISLSVFQQHFLKTTTFPSDIQHNWERDEKEMLEIFVLSSIGKQFSSKTNVTHSEVKLSGWMAVKHLKTKIKCCILMNSGDLKELNHPSGFTGRAKFLTKTQITCPVQSPLKEIKGVALQYTGRKCPQNDTSYIKPGALIKPPSNESFAICLKIVFGHLNVPLLVEWLEYNRVIGVDKIFMFTYNITKEVNDVLRHYVRLGFVEKRPYNYPRKNEYHIGEKKGAYWEDEQVVVSDCHQRLSLYRYISIVDLDEFIVPRKHDNIKDMMRYLMKQNPLAAGFTLISYLFIKETDANLPSVNNNSIIGSYFRRTHGLTGPKARRKTIVLPSRTQTKGQTTHEFLPVLHFRMSAASESIASLNHYRNCYSDLQKTCNQSLINDTYILKFLRRLKKNYQIE